MNLIDAARAVGVEHFVYTSFSSQIDLDFPLRNAKRAVEQRLGESGLNYTILRPSFFMELWLGPARFDVVNARAQIYGSGENPISWISLHDVAQFAVASLDNPAARNAMLELGGPEALSQLQAVQIFVEVGGRSFEVRHVTEEALEEQEKAATDPMQQSFAGLMRCYARGDAIHMQETLRAFPVQLTSVRDYAKSCLAPRG
jgi:NADH dehydrogenase